MSNAVVTKGLTPSSRTKLVEDPNDTAWSRSDKPLTRLEWKHGGSTLVAKNARHAACYSKGGSSHIHMVLREEESRQGPPKFGDERRDTPVDI